MIARLRLVAVLTRPAVAILLSLYAAIGAGCAGPVRYPALAGALVVVLGFLLFSVAINDLADEAIDRVNLPGDRRRPLASGSATRPDMMLLAAAGAGVAAVAAGVLGTAALVTTLGGIGISAAYSLQPVRLAERGAVAAMVLPACYVTVPFLDGLFAAGGSVDRSSLVLLAGLYVSFIGRILLKDFRDVRGDALFGKRTFLVRHGRVVTCRVSAVLLVIGGGLVAAALGPDGATLAVGYVLALTGCVVLLHRLAADPHPRREELRISALAILGRGMLVAVFAQLTLIALRWPWAGSAAVLTWIAVLTGGQAWTMLRLGPRARLTTAALVAQQPVDETPADADRPVAIVTG